MRFTKLDSYFRFRALEISGICFSKYRLLFGLKVDSIFRLVVDDNEQESAT